MHQEFRHTDLHVHTHTLVHIHILAYTYTPHLYAYSAHTCLHTYVHRLTSRILIELMKTYSDSDSSEADPKLIERLIVLVISDPRQFVFDHLLSLAPVAALGSQKIFKVSSYCSELERLV